MHPLPRIRVLSALVFSFVLLCSVRIAVAQSVPAWAPGVSYAIGNKVTYSSSTYSALQAHTSQVGWEPPNTPALWQSGGSAPGCSGAPNAPSGLHASSTTSTGTTLSWTAPSAPSGCSISGYTVYENGTSVGTTSGTSFAVGGLSPSTSYTFTVAASDGAGISAQSGGVSVTTSATSGNTGSGGCEAAWNASTAYTAGQKANVNGINYVANYWTQNQNPASNSGPAGSGQPWTSLGACSACTTVPSTPTGLSASSTTAFATTLTWSPSTVASNCSLSGYTVFRNGTSVGTSSGTSFTVSGLSPSTAYSFTVAGKDEAGSSGQSGAVSVTTQACTGSCNPGGTKLFAPYIDMSLSVDQQIVSIQQQSGVKAFTLAFLTAGGCSVGWGGVGGTLPQDTLPNGTTIQSLVQQLQASGVKIIISFGGANGQDPAAFCSSVSSLQAVYQSVINRYNVNMLDFDIEGGATSNQAAITLRNRALVALKAANPGLIVSYTLPVLPTGLINTGVNILNSVKADGLALDEVNVMAMDYGSAVDNGGQMGLNARLAASNTFNQLQAAGLGSTKIGVTPMIGVNDTNTEIFQLSDAQSLVDFAHSNSYIDKISMWSMARDNGSCAGAGFASPVCSSISQATYAFSQIFKNF
jgi:chitodextrinase